MHKLWSELPNKADSTGLDIGMEEIWPLSEWVIDLKYKKNTK